MKVDFTAECGEPAAGGRCCKWWRFAPECKVKGQSV